MNVVLTLLAICGLIVLAPMALATLLLVVASAIGVARTWRDGRRLRREFAQVVAEKRVSR